jgi:hypothetical protein
MLADIHMLLSQLTTAQAVSASLPNSADGPPYKTYTVLVGSLRIQLSVVRLSDDTTSSGSGGGSGGDRSGDDATARAAKIAAHMANW